MARILIVWDVKTRGSPATFFYRALKGYDYNTKAGRTHTPGVLDEMPEDAWEFVNQSTLLIEEEYARMVERIFKEFTEHLVWHRYLIEEE